MAVPPGAGFPFRGVHVAALALCAVFLPWSTAFLSMSQMLLAANWIAAGLAQGNARRRWRSVLTSAPALAFISFLALHGIGLLWTQDLGWGLDLCRILLPVLVFGVVLAGSEPLERHQLRLVLRLGAWSAIASGLFGLLFSGARQDDYRAISMFISHIRLALLICLAVAVLVWDWPRAWWKRSAHLAGIALSLHLLARLGSIQGCVILAGMAATVIWRWAGRGSAARRWGVRMALALLTAVPLALLQRAWSSAPRPQHQGPLAERTAGGEPYHHDTLSTQTENGTPVWTYVAWGELDRTWNLRSARRLDSTDALGHPMLSTVARYLSSKGLRKDSVGVMLLSETDVKAIEQGMPSAMLQERNGVRARLDEVLFELEQYRSSGRADGHSVAMRIEFLRAGWAIAKANWLFGVGTGDTQRAFDAHYESTRSALAPRWRLRAHNEYLTLLISFGLPGLLWSLFAWWWPAWRLGAWRDPLFIAWAIAFGISCLTDDTIETQAGATFFAFQYALLVFGARRDGLSAPTPAAPPAA